MANEKILNTRVRLKYDSYANWEAVKETFTPLQGELCIVNPGTQLSNTTKVPCLMKVGDGTTVWKDLPWVSATAADVYTWAKQSENDFVDTFLSLKMTDGTTMQTKLDGVFATDSELATAIGNLRNEIPTALGVMSIKVTDDDVVIGTPEAKTDGDVTINLSHKQYNKAGSTSDTSSDATTAGSSVIIKVPTLTVDAYGHTEFNGETSHTITIPDEVIDTNTAHTHKAGSGIKLDLTDSNTNGGINGEVKLDLNIAMELNDKEIKIYDKDDTSKTAIATLDATSFIKDGMIESVELVQENNEGTKGQYLKITWNIDDANSTDTGEEKDVTYVNVGDLVDVYTGSSNEDITVSVSNLNVISATLNKTFVESSEMANYKTKQTAYSNEGSTVKTVTKVEQNANGEVTVTYDNIAFPTPPVVNDGRFTVSGSGALTGSGAMTANQAGDTAAVLDIADKGITTAKIADAAVGAVQTKAYAATAGAESEEIWVFYCGTSSVLV